MVNPFDEFFLVAFFDDDDFAVLHRVLRSDCHGADENDFLGAGRDVDKAARSDYPVPEPTDIEVSLGVSLGQAQDTGVKAAAVVTQGFSR